jgi:HD-GYP domain-containing protein (c-di-GMP phosphodiesterase class II)
VLKKISVNQLTVGMFVHRFEDSWLNHPFWRTQFQIGDSVTLKKIKESGIGSCWIDSSRGQDVPPEAPPKPPASDVTDLEHVPKPSRQLASLSDELPQAARLRAHSALAMKRLFSDARLGTAIDTSVCLSLVDQAVESINRHPHALLSLTRLKNGDEYTYLHSVAVCALMVSLGSQLGLNNQQCREAGLAGMLHDLGKAMMPQEILNKPGKLLPEEFEIIKQHPRQGYELLVDGPDVTAAVKDVCLHHHERVDGSGYPDGLRGEQISLLARMGAVCDVYDALTSNRPYKNGWDPAHAISQMSTWQGHFDPVVFQSFVRSVGIYPTGSLVRMRSGRLAVVIEQNPAALTKPRVKLFFSTKAGVAIPPRILDLAAAEATDQIVARESPDNWSFDYLPELWGGDGILKQARS